jgi:archaellin
MFKSFKSKKAEMGIGTLIIFIALLLVAAIAAGVLIQTTGSLQEKALSTGNQAKGQIATNARIIEVSASDGRNGTVRYFTSIVKLASGSDAIKLSEVLVTMNTYDMTATLQYAGDSAVYENRADGYYTMNPTLYEYSAGGREIRDDYDNDQLIDRLDGGIGGNLILNLSTDGEFILGACVAGTPDYSAYNAGNYLSNTPVITCNDTNVTSVYLTPRDSGRGVFSVEYLQTGPNHVLGNLQRGDVIKIYYEAPRDIGEAEQVRQNMIPKIGTPTLTEYITPEVISEQRIYLYP